MTYYTKLIERLRDTPNWQRESYGDWKQGTVHYDRAPFEAADAIEALQGEVEQVKGFWKEAQLRNRNLLEENSDLAMLADQYKAERDALQATVTVREGQAHHWQEIAQQAQAERDALQAENERLTVKRDANKRMRDLHFAEKNALQAKLDELAKQEPVGRFVSDDDCGYIDLVPHHGHPLADGQAVYAAPKALEPLTRIQINQMMADAGWQNSAIRHADLDGVEKVVRAVERNHGITKGTP